MGAFLSWPSSLTFLLKRSQSQSKPFLHEKDELVLAHILVQIPPMKFQNLHTADQLYHMPAETSQVRRIGVLNDLLPLLFFGKMPFMPLLPIIKKPFSYI
jgi:hypothetical protein